jgi:hypothetical protein
VFHLSGRKRVALKWLYQLEQEYPESAEREKVEERQRKEERKRRKQKMEIPLWQKNLLCLRIF